ncbi:MAG: sugar phosphate isomerase/epimerase [Bryobacteraceae bacterium]|nr:sugar phosphate isomerase/epimerase [Bryobacteraceae bacterium]
MTRRHLLSLAAAASPAPAAGSHPIRLGGPIYLKSADPAELAREHRRLGYSAAYCPAAEVSDTARVKAIEEAFAKENVVIAEVGAWKNMLDPNPAVREENLKYVESRLALAEAVGARCCVDIAGSFNPKVWYGPHPKNLSQEFFDATVANCRRVIDAVKPKRTVFSLEIMGWNLPDGPDSYIKLIRAIDRKGFGVHLDAFNAINTPERFYNNAAYTRECFRRLAPWVASCHAKDVAWIPEMQVHFVEVIPGRGEIDYRPILDELSRLPKQPPLMMEHLKSAEEYEEAARHIRKVGAEIGATFA